MAEKKFELTNLATGKKSLAEVKSGTLGPDVLNIASLAKDHGMFTFDPGFMATAACESKITFIDGDEGVLLHRGIPIEQLAEKSNFLEVAYLMINGELPTNEQQAEFSHAVQYHTMINESLLRFFNGFQYNAHPMAMLSGVVASMAAFYHDSMDIHNPRHREIFAHRIIAKIPTIAAAAYKHALGQPFIYPRNDLDYCGNLLHMFFAVPCEQYNVDPVQAQALDLLFILHADHEQNASTSTVRLAGSTGANPYAAISSGISALWGPAHGGANEAVLAMLEQIGTVDNVPKFLAKAKDKNDNFRLMGFGHRVYKNFDPRATIIRAMATRCWRSSASPTIRCSSSRSSWKRSRSRTSTSSSASCIRTWISIPASSTAPSAFRQSMFTVMFAIARTVGWVAHWQEMIADPAMKISRPRQLYTGPAKPRIHRNRTALSAVGSGPATIPVPPRPRGALAGHPPGWPVTDGCRRWETRRHRSPDRRRRTAPPDTPPVDSVHSAGDVRRRGGECRVP